MTPRGFLRRNAGRRLTSRRWGIATIRCTRPFLCRPPTKNGKGLEDESTIVLDVDQVDVAGSEGEAMFGDPRCVTMEEPMRRWLNGLRDGSGGYVNQKENTRLVNCYCLQKRTATRTSSTRSQRERSENFIRQE